MKKFGLLGEKLSHSKSPEIHREIFKYLNMEGTYDLLETDKEGLPSYISKYDGLNVTIPYKEEIMKSLDSISKEATEIDAVNTIYKNVGYNTDYFGFQKMLEIKGVSVENKDAYILGTGGASKAIYAYLVNNNAKNIYFVSRSKKTEETLVYKDLENRVGDIIINTTPVGMYPNIEDSPVSEEVVKNFDIVLDIVYNPLETKILKMAKENNKVYANGLYMLIGQAVKAEEIWNNVEIDNSLIEEIYKKLTK